MQNIGFYSEKISLGQLSSKVIMKGYKYLKELEEIIEDINNPIIEIKFTIYLPNIILLFHIILV